MTSTASPTTLDVVVVGAGPGGASAALALGRSRRRVLLCDSGPRRNAAATHVHNFLTRDGTPPVEMRRLAREDLARYPNVTVQDSRVEAISGSMGAFEVRTDAGGVKARRVLLCTGMLDNLLPIDGFEPLWGHSIFQCPYCHGWEVQDRRWGFLVSAQHAQFMLPFAIQLRAWTDDLVVFTNGASDLPEETKEKLARAGIQLVTEPIARLVASERQLEAVALRDGTSVPCEILYAHPPQRQVPLITELGLELDEHGYVRVDDMGETTIPGIYAAGDLTTPKQAAVLSAAAAFRVVTTLNVSLGMELTS